MNDGNKIIHDPVGASSSQELERLLDRYPFNALQLQILLRINALSPLPSLSATSPSKFSEIIDEATRTVSKNSSTNHALQWIETHLIPPQTLNALLHVEKEKYKKDSKNDANDSLGTNNGKTNFMNRMSQITGRKGDPNYGLICIFNLLAYMQEGALNWNHDDQSGEIYSECHNNSNRTGQETFDDGSSCENSDQVGIEGPKVDIILLLDFMYRLSLACHVLQNWNEEHHQSNDFIYKNEIDKDKDYDKGSDCQKEGSIDGAPSKNPQSVHRECPDLDQVLECLNMQNVAMVSSLKEFSSKRDVSSSQEFNNFDERGPNLMNEVDCQNWLDWNRLNFPQMSSIPSSFMHLALFSSLEEKRSVEVREEPQQNIDATEFDEGNDRDDDDSWEGAMIDKLAQYAMGNRTKFQFPTLEKAIMASSNIRSIGQKYVTSMDVKSDGNSIIDNGSIVQGGRIGHFAFGLVLMDARLCGKWNRIYSTETDGFSFLNLQKALTGYSGPTILLMKPSGTSNSSTSTSKQQTSGLFGSFTSTLWKESNAYYGTSDCFLFRSEPVWNKYRPKISAQGWNGLQQSTSLPPSLIMHPSSKKSSTNYMYFHPSAGHRQTTTALGSKPRGLIFGGTLQDPRVHITESLENCIASSGGPRDTTFEGGPLMPGQWDKFFNIDILEVWGVGSDETIIDAIHARERSEGIANATRKRVQRVDKKQFLDDFQSQIHTGSKLFAHRNNGVRYDFDGDLGS